MGKIRIHRSFKGKYFRINEEIRAPQLRVIHPTEGQVGILSREEALTKARAENLDLVEVAPTAEPPVARIVDFAKFKYEQAKKIKASKKGISETKQLRLRPFMDEHDLQIRAQKIAKFLQDGDRVKVEIRFLGREITKKKFGFDLINRLMLQLESIARLQSQPRLKDNVLGAIIVARSREEQAKTNQT